VKPCPICKALEHLQTIDDARADELVMASDMSEWCGAHMRAWIDVRNDPHRGRARLEGILKRAAQAR
jgi:hypothetical protein